MSATILMFAASILGQEAGAGKVDAKLDFMKAAAASYRIALDGDTARLLHLQAEPSFRMGKQAADAGVEEGAIFFWADEVGRPEAAAQVFLVRNSGAPNGLWIHEFISLSPGTFTGERAGRSS